MSCSSARPFGVSLVVLGLLAPHLFAAGGVSYDGVASPNPKAANVPAPDVLTRELVQSIVAQGSWVLENGTANFPYYGYDGDNANLLPAPGDVQSMTHNVEATKTEPDKNTYLILKGLSGADPLYNYGTHFLYQGHELGTLDPNTGIQKGYITRINLDADGAHRVTLMATTDVNGAPLPVIDGSTWHPWSKRLLFSYEGGTKGGIWQATADYPSSVVDLLGVFGHGGFEGMQSDSDGTIWVVEDSGGSTGKVNTHAKQANSFVYRLIPADVTDLTKGGKLQALQVMSLANPGQPISFHSGQADADILSQDEKDLHTYGKSFTTNWVTIHDNATDGFLPFDANALAKAALATPFKRPENGQFRPGADFREFYFDETGDTNLLTEAGSAYGGFGSVLKLAQSKPSANNGTLSLLYLCDSAHSGFDNCAFWGKDQIVFVEDAGDTLHTQRNAFDSAYLLDVTVDYSNPATPAPTRIIALGRDTSATIDSAFSALGNGFQNEGDNELTGFHVSDGDADKAGILGNKVPNPFDGKWRVFWTQQHGDNFTYEMHLSGLK